MTNQDYLKRVLKAQKLTGQELNILRLLRNEVESFLSVLDGGPRFYYAGSYGKKTMIRECYDLDIVVYWPKDSRYTIKGIYDGVGKRLSERWVVNPKTVSWEIPFEGGFHIDVVPGRALDSNYIEANLYRKDTGTTLKTSLKTHIDTVRDSGRRDVIRLLKLWRERRNVPFKKSFLLELMTIYGCSEVSLMNLEEQAIAGLEYIRNNIEATRVKDPANTNNSLSDDISARDKTRIRIAAQAALDARYWSEVLD
jgi:hypothetical protein